MTRGLSLFLVCTVCFTVACDSGTASNAFTQPTATAPTQTETFTGTLVAQGTNLHAFTVSQQGPLAVTLTSASPPPTIFLGLGVGTPVGSSCNLLATASAQSGTVPQLNANVAIPGPFCLAVVDIGNVSADVTYAVTVGHT